MVPVYGVRHENLIGMHNLCVFCFTQIIHGFYLPVLIADDQAKPGPCSTECNPSRKHAVFSRRNVLTPV